MFKGGFKDIFKKKVMPPESQEIETSVLLMLRSNGGATIPIIDVKGVKQLRTATLEDLYRMVCEVKRYVEEVRTSDYVLHALMNMHPAPAPKPDVRAETVTPKAEPEAPIVETKEGENNDETSKAS
jgi:hypothetical protein